MAAHGKGTQRSSNLTILARRFQPFRQKAVTAIDFGLDMLVAGMKIRAPYRSGRLRKTIHKTPVRNDHSKHRLVGRAVCTSRYALYQEFGTVHNRAHPFVRPTQAIDGPMAVRAMANILRS